MSLWNRNAYRWLTISTLGAALLATGCKKQAADTADTEAAAAVAVQAQHPTTGPISEEIQADAVLAPLAEAAIEPKITSPIRTEYVQRGAKVHKGELLLTLEDRDLRGSALDSQGALSSAQAAYTTATRATIPEDQQKAELDVAQAKANLEVANRTADERKRLAQQGAISGRDADLSVAAAVQAQAAYDTAVKHLQNLRSAAQQASIQAAQGQLTSAKGRMMNADAQVGYANLRSPIDGYVTDRPYFPGEIPAAGAPVITVMDTSSVIAKLHIGQATAERLHLGAQAEVAVPGVDQPQQGTVSLISPALDPGSTTVEIWVKLPNADGRLKVGTPVHVSLHGNTIANALQVPVSAIMPADDGGTNVLLVSSDGTVKKHSVQVGLRTQDAAQILSGISTSDLVITDGGYGLDDGTKVKVGAATTDTSDAGEGAAKGAKQ
jgi:multidrug efflux pump subunit AcrA (membrane-fusion protein)